MSDQIDQEQLDIANRIEALLFLAAEPLSFDKIRKHVKSSGVAVKKALAILDERYQETSLEIIVIDDKYELAAIPQYSAYLTEYQKDYVVRDLSPAALEVLSIVIFKGPISKLEIEDLRGINSSQSLRRLKVLGLIEEPKSVEKSSSDDEKAEINPFYEISPKLLKHFGFKTITECQAWFEESYKGEDKKEKEIMSPQKDN